MAEVTRPRCSCCGVERPARCCCLICPNHILFLHLAYYPHGHLWRPPRNAWMRTVRECVCPMPPIASSLRSNGHRLRGMSIAKIEAKLHRINEFEGITNIDRGRGGASQRRDSACGDRGGLRYRRGDFMQRRHMYSSSSFAARCRVDLDCITRSRVAGAAARYLARRRLPRRAVLRRRQCCCGRGRDTGRRERFCDRGATPASRVSVPAGRDRRRGVDDVKKSPFDHCHAEADGGCGPTGGRVEDKDVQSSRRQRGAWTFFFESTDKSMGVTE